MNKKDHSADDFLNQAYSLEDDQSKLDFYKKWADDYDHQMQDNLHYTSPDTICSALAGFFVNKNEAVLDVGCGTGLTAAALVNLGYESIDGLDYSSEMIDVANSKGIYQQLFVADLNQPLKFADQTYSALVCSGTFTHAHVGPGPIDELMRILKPDGFFACTVHQDLWQKMGFKAKFETLEKTGKIRNLHFTSEAYFEGAPADGLFCVYQKTA